MMVSLQSYVQKGQRTLHRLVREPKLQLGGRILAYFLAGFCLSAAALGHAFLPFAMGLVCACSGWAAVLAALGGTAGYLVFWGSAGQQGIVWLGAGLMATLLLSQRQLRNQTPFLLPAVAGLLVSAAGVFFQGWLQEDTSVGMYVLRVLLAIGSTWLFMKALQGRNPILDWLVWAVAVLALVQIVPVQYFSLGFLAAGVLATAGAFPAAALAGVALDLAAVTPVSMTAVLCCGYLIRFVPKAPKSLCICAPAVWYLVIMRLCGHFDMLPLPGLFLGSLLGAFLPLPAKVPARRGETGVAQVRLEMAAGALSQTGQLLLQVQEVPVDEDALVQRAAERACGGCPCRKGCKDSRRVAQLPSVILHKPLLTSEELPIVCRKSGRFLAELHRSQEYLRSIQADRERQKEYRAAVLQQYRFLAEYLQELSDQLSQKPQNFSPCYEAKVLIFGNRPEADNGDKVCMFAGVHHRYYVILCDGMGTGMGAVQEGRTAGIFLQKLLSAGFPTEYALESLNSLCALRGRAGAVTIELLELQLDTGKAFLYKWGAAPSYIVSKLGAEKVGTAGPPPGLSVTDHRQTVYRLSLRRGEMLVLVSDGVGEEGALHCCTEMADRSPGELAASLLASCQLGGEDDATVVLVTLEQKGIL